MSPSPMAGIGSSREMPTEPTPIPLRQRLPRHDSIGELERASLDRFRDSFVLATRGRRHAAVYLLGYYVEMTLKTIFFRCFGCSFDEPIGRKDLEAAGQLVREQFRIPERLENYHNPVFWARAIIGMREMFGLRTPVGVTQELVWSTQRVYEHWVVGMRYTRDLARIEDWNCVREDALWIRANFAVLTTTKEAPAIT